MYKEHFIFKTNKISKLNESSSEVARIGKIVAVMMFRYGN